ncbi:MAG: adenosylcobinamide-GDP ribazoletransferase [Herpetosiphon sp.]
MGEALRFLTILAVPGLPAPDDQSVARAVPAFPLVGLIVGGVTVATGWVAGSVWGPAVRAVVVVLAGALLTAGLHLDGVADSCDGLLSWRSRERMLEIMKDSRIGTMGALGLLTVVGLKVLALAQLGGGWWIAALVAPVWGRWAGIHGIFWFPSATSTGLGGQAREHIRGRDYWIATGLTGILSVGVVGPWGLAVAVVVPTSHLLAARMSRTLGGLTGDSYGALIEVGEVVALLTLLALHLHGWIG